MGIFSSKQKQESTTSNNAAGFVQPWLTQSTNAYGSLATPETFGGDWQASLDPMLSGAWGNMYNNPQGAQYQQQMGNFGGQAMNSMAAQMANPNQAFQYNQGTFDQTMGNLMPAMQGSYDAATRDNNRNLNWQQLPGLNMGASQSGQQGSTKVGQASALAQGMNMDRNSDIGASMYQNAVNQANNNAMSAGTQNLGAQMQMYGMGQNAMQNAYNMNQGNLQNQLSAGQGMQGYNQQGIDYNRAAWDQTQQNPWLYEGQRLGALSSVGSAFGTTKNTKTSKSNPGIGNIALQLGSAYRGGGGGNPFSFLGGGGGGQLAPITGDINGTPFGQLYR